MPLEINKIEFIDKDRVLIDDRMFVPEEDMMEEIKSIKEGLFTAKKTLEELVKYIENK